MSRCWSIVFIDIIYNSCVIFFSGVPFILSKTKEFEQIFLTYTLDLRGSQLQIELGSKSNKKVFDTP